MQPALRPQGFWIGICLFLIMCVAFGSVLFAVQIKDSLKTEINSVSRHQCVVGSRATVAIFGKYNDFVLSFIQHEKVSERKDLADGLKSNAANDAALVKRLTNDRLPIVKQNCSVPYLH